MAYPNVAHWKILNFGRWISWGFLKPCRLLVEFHSLAHPLHAKWHIYIRPYLLNSGKKKKRSILLAFHNNETYNFVHLDKSNAKNMVVRTRIITVNWFFLNEETKETGLSKEKNFSCREAYSCENSRSFDRHASFLVYKTPIWQFSFLVFLCLWTRTLDKGKLEES